MLSDVCPDRGCRGTPLMALASKPKLCVCCSAEYDATTGDKLGGGGGGGAATPPTAQAAATLAAAPAAAVPKYVPPAKRKATDAPLEDTAWQKVKKKLS